MKVNLFVVIAIAILALSHGVSYANDITASGKQKRGQGADGELSGEGFSIPAGQIGTITAVDGDCDEYGFWVEGQGDIRRFKPAGAGVNAVFSAGSYRVYPNLKPAQNEADVGITIRLTPATVPTAPPGTAGSAPTSGLPPVGLRQIIVKPLDVAGAQVSADPEVLRPGIYTVWVRIGERVPAREVDSGTVTVDRGGAWTAYANVNFSPGGKPHHVTVFPDMLNNNTVDYKDFDDPRYGTPGANDFILHFENRSLTKTVTYVFEPMTGPTPSKTAPNFSGKWRYFMGNAGTLNMNQLGSQVTGNYSHGTISGAQGTIKGTITGQTLRGSWVNTAKNSGTLEFVLSADGQSFKGFYLVTAGPLFRQLEGINCSWNGERE